MIKDIREINFPEYATIEQATVTINDMGDRSISTQVKIDGSVVPNFSYDWKVEFKGERYIHPVKTPQGTKDNTSRKSKIDLVFQHWAIYEMKRQYFVEMASTSAGTAIADKYIASLGLNLGDFVTAFNLVLNHYFGGRIIIKLNPEWQYDTEAKFVSISYSYIWDVLQQIHEIYGVRWTLKTNTEGVCEILMGYPAKEVSHIFEYGFEGGLLSVQRQVQSTDIRNRLLGRGGSKNLPYRYFKDKDPKNPLFEADPDWIPELANIAFTELRGKTFRDYVRGWKAKRYGGTPMAVPTEAYLAGYNAEKFNPIEYVDDKESIEKYGVLVGALENNEEIYPSIQGAPGDVDMIVDAEQVTDDDVDAAVENDSVTTNLESGHQTYRNAPANSLITVETLTKRYFSIPSGKVGNLDMSLAATGKYSDLGNYEKTYPILNEYTVEIYNAVTGALIVSSSQLPVLNIPSGDYFYMVSANIETNYDEESMVTLNIESVHLYTYTPDVLEEWKSTFDIWIGNIWNTSPDISETDEQYANRVWEPILGDRAEGEARVVFASGWLSFSSDWEFPIVGYAYDESKDGSHWRLTLAKSEAEKDAGKPFIPYEGYNASAGDRFFFVGVDLPWQYVYWAEESVDNYKRNVLPNTSEIKPAWVIRMDKVRLNQERLNENDEKIKLINELKIGSHIRLANKQFISGVYESLYIQSITYNWTSNSILYPDVEVVVSDKVATVKNPVAQIQGNIETLQRQMGNLSNIQQIIRQVCDQLYLRKDGVEDFSKSPTKFLGKVTGEKFRQGQIGGRDWGIYRDENGNAILEADKLVARLGIVVSDLVVNEATYVGGLQINSAASMKIVSVERGGEDYICYFDQKQGSVTNKFKINDVAFCQKFDAEDKEVKSYKARVIAVSEASVTLSSTYIHGEARPAEDDEIIHFGNYTDKTRQFVIIRDVIGGGYERMLMGLDSVNSDGVEYYFAGKSADGKARWFVGDSQQYAKYENGQLTIKGNLFVTGSDESINDQLDQLEFIKNAFGNSAQGLILGTAIIVGYNDDQGNFVPMAGMSGVFDKDSENGGPAAWYGGTPDKAKSVIFMDGTGYFADGLFKWDKETGINLGNGQIRINYDGSIDFGGDIRIGNTGEETLDSLLTIVAGLAEMWKIDDDGNLVTTRQVVIKNSLVVENDMSTGGEGNVTSVGITGVLIDSKEYKDVNSEGLLDLTEAFKNSGVSVDLSNYYTKEEVDKKIADLETGTVDLSNYYTKEEVYNKQETYSKDEVNELIKGGESDMFAWADEAKTTIKTEKNLIVEGELSDSGVAGNVTVGISTIRIDSKDYTDTDRDGIIDLTDALKAFDFNLEDYATKAEVSVINTKVNSLVDWKEDFLKYIYIGDDGLVHVTTDIIIGGDIATAADGEGGGSYASIGIIVGNSLAEYPNTAGIVTLSKELITSGIGLGELAFKDSLVASDIPDLSGKYLSLGGGNVASLTIGGNTAIHSGNISSQSVAYATNAGMATKLQTARKIWGQSFDGTTDITGWLYLPNMGVTAFYDTVGNAINVLHFSDANNLHLGYGNRTKAYNTFISGNDIYLYYGSGTPGFILNSSGNVGIGSISPAYKLDVRGITRSTDEFISTNSKGIGFRTVNGGYGVFFQNGGSNCYLLTTAQNDAYGTYNSLRPFAFNLSTGKVTLGEETTVSKLLTANGGATIPTGKTLLLGSKSLGATLQYITDVGVKIDGNLVVTGDLSDAGVADNSGSVGGYFDIAIYPQYAYGDIYLAEIVLNGSDAYYLYMPSVTEYIGYTPFNEAEFTRDNIKSRLGISDWALAASKPSYTTNDVSEGDNLYFTNARARNAVFTGSSSQFLKADGTLDSTTYLGLNASGNLNISGVVFTNGIEFAQDVNIKYLNNRIEINNRYAGIYLNAGNKITLDGVGVDIFSTADDMLIYSEGVMEIGCDSDMEVYAYGELSMHSEGKASITSDMAITITGANISIGTEDRSASFLLQDGLMDVYCDLAIQGSLELQHTGNYIGTGASNSMLFHSENNAIIFEVGEDQIVSITEDGLYVTSINNYKFDVATAVTSGSSGLVTSGAVYSAFSLFPSNAAVKNDRYLAFRKTDDYERRIFVSTSNEFYVGYGNSSSSLVTRVFGSPILFHAGNAYTDTNLMMGVRESGVYIPHGKNLSFGTESDNIPMTYKSGVLNIGGDVVIEGDIATTA